ncbi:hypothetical protein [Clostridium sp.]|uniref:hypothetical protein n=1 Tax=Clostridium sp. TaxID=1506 RepID=UPI002908E8F2|nr:hypothetical protein [Clostridium sp.]MDU5105780.1 hypothetical protein [Clostridium sp.]
MNFYQKKNIFNNISKELEAYKYDVCKEISKMEKIDLNKCFCKQLKRCRNELTRD